MRELLGLDAAAALPRLKQMAARDPHPETRAAARVGVRPGRKRRLGEKGRLMARIIPCAEERMLSLGDLVQALNDESFDPADEESFAAAAPLLKGLANNRDFLAEIAIAELKDRCNRQSLENRYSSQVIMLHRASEKYFIRANFWPSPRDSVFKASGTSPFFYHVPHDHNFSFLTVGYLGPGYWSEYYEYDYGEVVGLPGEKVDLRFIEKAKLDQGKVMLYRAHRDVHNQLPADDMSISINIMEASNRLPFLSQYQFDVRNARSPESSPAPRARRCSRSPPIMAVTAAIWSKASPPRTLRPDPVRRVARTRLGGRGLMRGLRCWPGAPPPRIATSPR